MHKCDVHIMTNVEISLLCFLDGLNICTILRLYTANKTNVCICFLDILCILTGTHTHAFNILCACMHTHRTLVKSNLFTCVHTYIHYGIFCWTKQECSEYNTHDKYQNYFKYSTKRKHLKKRNNWSVSGMES